MLVLLDNARDAAQVSPLLPGSPGCAAHRDQPRQARRPGRGPAGRPGRDGAGRGAGRCSPRSPGAERVAAERAAAMDVVAACGFLPLAVRIVAARLAARPSWTVASLVPRLADERRRLDEMRVGNLAVEATFALGYGQLEPGPGPRVPAALACPAGPTSRSGPPPRCSR